MHYPTLEHTYAILYKSIPGIRRGYTDTVRGWDLCTGATNPNSPTHSLYNHQYIPVALLAGTGAGIGMVVCVAPGYRVDGVLHTHPTPRHRASPCQHRYAATHDGLLVPPIATRTPLASPSTIRADPLQTLLVNGERNARTGECVFWFGAGCR
jgi:hypothetical protein